MSILRRATRLIARLRQGRISAASPAATIDPIPDDAPAEPPVEIHCGPIDPGHVVVQHLRCPVDHLSGVALHFGTYRRIMRHRLRLQLARIDETTAAGPTTTTAPPVIVAVSDLDAARVRDGAEFYFYFPAIENSRGALLVLTISSDGAAPDHALTVWLSRGANRIPGHVSCRSRRTLDPDYGLRGTLITSDPVAGTAFPEGLLYSPLSSCNLNCIHCVSRHTRDRVFRTPEQTKQDIARHAAAGQLRWMFTDYSGDIFFAERKSPGALSFVLDLGVTVHIDTNGACLDQAVLDRVMASKVDALNISIDAARDATFRRIRVGAPPVEQIFAAARLVVEARTRHGRENDFRIGLGFTLMHSNLHELPLFIEKAAEIGVDSVNCRHLEIYHADTEAESLFFHKAEFNEVRASSLALARRLSLPLLIGEALEEQPDANGLPPCTIPWGSAVVVANGDVLACCVPGSKMGSLNERSLEEIWQGEAYRRLRARVNSADPPELCRHCHYRRSLDSYDDVAALRANRNARSLLEELVTDSTAGVQ